MEIARATWERTTSDPNFGQTSLWDSYEGQQPYPSRTTIIKTQRDYVS